MYLFLSPQPAFCTTPSCYRHRNVVFYTKDLLSVGQELAADSDIAQRTCKALNELRGSAYGVRDRKKIKAVLF